jgi:hypothetical protein
MGFVFVSPRERDDSFVQNRSKPVLNASRSATRPHKPDLAHIGKSDSVMELR